MDFDFLLSTYDGVPSMLGIGAQFGGKYFCHDVRVVRLPRHGASCPVGIGVSCSADRQVRPALVSTNCIIILSYGKLELQLVSYIHVCCLIGIFVLMTSLTMCYRPMVRSQLMESSWNSWKQIHRNTCRKLTNHSSAVKSSRSVEGHLQITRLAYSVLIAPNS